MHLKSFISGDPAHGSVRLISYPAHPVPPQVYHLRPALNSPMLRLYSSFVAHPYWMWERLLEDAPVVGSASPSSDRVHSSMVAV